MILTLAFICGEVIAGYMAHSVALISDAGHNLSDAAALGFSWSAVYMSKRASTAKRTFGFHRMNILAALANALSLVAVAVIILWEAIRHLVRPHAADGGIMIIVALLAIAVNLLISFWLRSGRDDLNVRSAHLHMLGDAASAAGVVIAGIVVKLTGSTMADSIVALLISGLILWSSWSTLKEATNVLLESSPEGTDMKAVEAEIKNVPGVLDIHDLHVWTITSGMIACSCHVLVAEQTVREGQQVLKAIVDMLRERHKICHTTVQIEVEGCEADEMYCTMHPDHTVAHHHD